jgi:hypothetical protein
MLKNFAAGRRALIVSQVLSLTLATPLLAQTTANSSNADIVKMIQAGLPESTIVNKIREGAGHWDTSVDALIAVKKAGATEAEMNAILAAPSPANGSPSTVGVAIEPPDTFVSVLRGKLRNQNGDITLFEPGFTTNPRDPSNMLFHLVTVDGRPALKLAVMTEVYSRMGYGCASTHGDLVFEQNQVAYYPYGESKCNEAKWTIIDKLTPVVYHISDIKPRGAIGMSTGTGFNDAFLVDGTPLRFVLGETFHKKGKGCLPKSFLVGSSRISAERWAPS